QIPNFKILVGTQLRSLNFDNFVTSKTRQASTGGMFRDKDGRCIAAYSMNS
ncbi:hypothetical protein LINPERPRIM_LOCUS4034, partial [Linum perenne]